MSSLEVDGAAGLPVLSTGSLVQSEVSKYESDTGTFYAFELTTNSVWISEGSAQPMPIYFPEGFFIDRPTTNN